MDFPQVTYMSFQLSKCCAMRRKCKYVFDHKKNFSKTEKRKILDDRILKKDAARKIDVDENEKQEESPERIPKKKKELAEGEVKVPKPRKRVPAHAEEGAAVEEGAEKKKTARVKSKAKIEEEEKVTDPEVKKRVKKPAAGEVDEAKSSGASTNKTDTKATAKQPEVDPTKKK